MITHVKQPTRMSCVQACMAMVTGKPIDYVFTVLPDNPLGTEHKLMVVFLRCHGYKVQGRFTRLRKGQPIPDFAIVRIVFPNGDGHVVVRDGRNWYDPDLTAAFMGVPPPSAPTWNEWTNGGRITSYLDLGPKPHYLYGPTYDI